jgi:hypothetical protein
VPDNFSYVEKPVYSVPVAGANRFSFVGAPPTPEDPPVLSAFSPVVGAAIGTRDALRFTVQPVGGELRRETIMVSFPLLGLTEVAFDGEAFTKAYPAAQGNARVANGTGWDFTLQRTEGWPASPRLLPLVTDEFGNTNDVDSTNYAWTLTRG